MELLQQILEGALTVFWGLVDLLEPLVAALIGAVFDVQVAPGGARGFTIVLLVVIGSWSLSKLFFGVTKSPAIQPMTVVHHTTKTPAQVVLEDLGAKGRVLLVIGAVLAVVYAIGSLSAP